MRYRINQPLARARKRHPKLFLLIVLLVVVALSLVIRGFAAPVAGRRISVDRTVAQPKPHASVQTPASTLDNAFFILQLPVGYALQTSQMNSGGMLYTATIIHPSIDGSRIIGISVSQLPAGGLGESSFYRARVLAPQTYIMTPLKTPNESIMVATRIDHEAGEAVAFWPHGSLLATLSVSTGEASSEADQASNEVSLQALLRHWQWR